MSWDQRTQLLLGQEALERLRTSHVIVFGLGGVGAYAAEHLCRAGIGTLTLVDGDEVHSSNLNRQLPALHSTLGRLKCEVLVDRLRDIRPDIKLHMVSEYVKDQRMIELLQADHYDFVVDAIDTFSPKTYLIVHALRLNLPLVSSMGSGAKIDPMQVRIADIAQTYSCPLAEALRKRLHRMHIYSGFDAVFSPEKPLEGSVIPSQDDPNKKSTVGTISYMPPLFGACCASVVIRRLLAYPIHSDLPIPKKIKRCIEMQDLDHSDRS